MKYSSREISGLSKPSHLRERTPPRNVSICVHERPAMTSDRVSSAESVASDLRTAKQHCIEAVSDEQISRAAQRRQEALDLRDADQAHLNALTSGLYHRQFKALWPEAVFKAKVQLARARLDVCRLEVRRACGELEALRVLHRLDPASSAFPRAERCAKRVLQQVPTREQIAQSAQSERLKLSQAILEDHQRLEKLARACRLSSK